MPIFIAHDRIAAPTGSSFAFHQRHLPGGRPGDARTRGGPQHARGAGPAASLVSSHGDDTRGGSPARAVRGRKREAGPGQRRGGSVSAKGRQSMLSTVSEAGREETESLVLDAGQR